MRSEACICAARPLAEAYELVYNAIMDLENGYPDPKSLARHPPGNYRVELKDNLSYDWYMQSLSQSLLCCGNTLQDLATAFIQVLGNEKASKQIFNISTEKYVTFDGLAKACAKAAGFPEPEIVHYKPKEFDFLVKRRHSHSVTRQYICMCKNVNRMSSFGLVANNARIIMRYWVPSQLHNHREKPRSKSGGVESNRIVAIACKGLPVGSVEAASVRPLGSA
ncbi:hypothetical protein IFM89_008921 [Coptis chinensis]|uniref:Uncharacterized protein n=1 Tax=Coptis chinensis TaxID=261450 RepID=A0A835H201_9MAGN|nr:hypothetical protein IFM89_008921 [Coptis chinensis]